MRSVPRRRKLTSVLVIGSGLDHAGAVACRVFKAEGLRVTVVNGDPVSAMTDPESADATYVEPVTPETVEMVIAVERPNALLPTVGGLDTAVALYESGALARYGVELLRGLSRFSTNGAPVTELAMGHTLDELRDDGTGKTPAHGEKTTGPEVVLLGAEFDLVPIVGTSTTATSFELGVVDHTIDVDALYDGHELFLGGVLEHVGEGDSVCALPPITLGRADVVRIRESTGVVADRMEVRGLINVRYALVSGVLRVLKATPWAGRTVPFVSRATGVPLMKAAARIVLGSTIAELRAEGLLPAHGDGGSPPPDAAIAVRQSRFHGVDEVMGLGASFGPAYAKAQAAASTPLPTKGRAFVSVANRDRRAMIFPVKTLADNGFEILATSEIADLLHRNGVQATTVHPPIADRVLAGEVDLVVNTMHGQDDHDLRAAATTRGIPHVTTVQGLSATVQGIEAINRGDTGIVSLQEHAAGLRRGRRA